MAGLVLHGPQPVLHFVVQRLAVPSPFEIRGVLGLTLMLVRELTAACAAEPAQAAVVAYQLQQPGPEELVQSELIRIRQCDGAASKCHGCRG